MKFQFDTMKDYYIRCVKVLTQFIGSFYFKVLDIVRLQRT